jgi:RHS repeat-associated protein
LTLLSEFGSIKHDGAGNILSKTDTVGAYPSLGGNISNSYDSLDQLSGSDSTRTATGMGYTQSFGVDAGGNITTMRGSTVGYNTDNEISASGFTYDNNGNPTTYNGSTYTYDPENHVTSFGTPMTATYRADGLRASKTSSSTTTYFIYDIFGNPVYEEQGGSLSAINTFGVNGLVSRYTGSYNAFYQFDERGDTVSRSNASGTVLDYHGSDPFGIQYTSATSVDPYQGFGAQWGYYYDHETGYSLLGQRYYDPAYGRFLNADPLGLGGGVNKYTYALANPHSNIDPSGLRSWEDIKGDLFDDLAQAGAGIGHLLHFDGYYENMGIACEINKDSAAYKIGQVGFTTAALIVTGGIAGEGVATEAVLEEAPEMETAIEGTDEGAVECENGCFVAGTPLQIAGTDDLFSSLLPQSLTEPIEQAGSGKIVMSADPADGIAEAQQPTAYFIHQVHDVVTVGFADSGSTPVSETITCAPNHPFFTSHGIEPAGLLHTGDVVLTRDGHGMVVVSEKTKHGLFTVYNLTVNKDHTYYVGTAHGGIWVHNDCNISQQKLQHIFSKHAEDFGVDGNWNPENGQELEQAIQSHIDSVPGTNGFYRGQAITNYMNSDGLWAGVNSNNDLVAAMKLGAEQMKAVLAGGNMW